MPLKHGILIALYLWREKNYKIANKEYHLKALTCINFSVNVLKITPYVW
jgi:hypothetical protein